MKKQILTIAATAVLISSVFSNVYAADGTVSVSGLVSSNTCTLDTLNTTKTIEFPAVKAADVNAGASWYIAADAQPVDIVVTNCSAAQEGHDFYAVLDYTANPLSDHMANTGTATNILPLVTTQDVKVGETAQGSLVIKTGGNSPKVAIASNAATSTFYIALQRNSNKTVTDGSIESSLEYTLHVD